MKNRTTSGDTIVEVLIALAVVGFVMSIGYSMASRSLRVVRQSQERVEALKLAESQIEALKNLQRNDPAGFQNVQGFGRPFCMFSDGSAYTQFTGGATQPDYTNLASDDFNYTSFAPPGNKCMNQGLGGLYNVSIVGPKSTADTFSLAPPINNGNFTVRVRWYRFGGGKDEVKLEYVLFRQ